MTRKKPEGLAAGMEEPVEPGEGGGPPMGDTGGIGTSDTIGVTPDETDYSLGSTEVGATTGISNLQLEVDILSAAAVDRVAQEIARRVSIAAKAATISSVTVASPAVIAFLRLHAAVDAEVSSLESMAEQLAASAGADRDAIETSDTSALAIPVIAAAAKAIPAVVGKAAQVLRSFAATTAYSGRSNRARQVLLDAALAKHLALNKLDVGVPERSLPASEPRGLIARILRLQSRCRELQEQYPDADYGPLMTSVDTLVGALFGTGENRAASLPLAQQLMLADGVASGFGKGNAVLFAEIVFSGGSYRTRRWIFNFLFGQDGLTYNGGAGVTFFLFRADDRRSLDSDTIYFASPHGRFREDRAGPLEPSNISDNPTS